MQEPIYLDHAASTPVRPEVREAMLPFFGATFGNPSSTHRWGREARAALDEAHERVARCLGAHVDEICFTSGGTEADNLAVLGVWHARRSSGRNAAVTAPTEHKAVLGAAHQIAREGGEERLLAVDADGLVDDASFDALVDSSAAVCSVMWVNNETGVVQPIARLAERARERGVTFHTDAVQAFGKLEVDVRRTPVDVLSISGHKIGAPKGSGALFLRRGTPIESLFHGGSQDRGRRPGTENVAYAVGLAVACELAIAEREEEAARLDALRQRLERALVERVPDVVVHGRGAPRAPHILSLSVPGTESESLLMALDLRGVAASGGSACQSGAVTASHVLVAMGVPYDVAVGTLRVSLGALTTDAHVAHVAELLPALVARARATSAA